jgi:hypothetical protein
MCEVGRQIEFLIGTGEKYSRGHAADGSASMVRPRVRPGPTMYPRISPPQLAQAILGLLFQIFEGGTLGSVDFDIDPSFPGRPASASLGLEVRVI